MKRIKYLVLLFFILLLCGCTKTKLVCEKLYNNESYKAIIHFKNNKPSKLIYTIDYNYDSEDAYIDMKLLEIEEEYQIYDNILGLTYNITENDNDLIAKINIDYKIYNSDKLNIPIIKDNINNNKTNFQLAGYSCK